VVRSEFLPSAGGSHPRGSTGFILFIRVGRVSSRPSTAFWTDSGGSRPSRFTLMSPLSTSHVSRLRFTIGQPCATLRTDNRLMIARRTTALFLIAYVLAAEISFGQFW